LVNLLYTTTDFEYHDNDGHANAQLKLSFSYVDAPVLLWSTGCKIIGADYAVALAQPFDATLLRIGTSTRSPGTMVPTGLDVVTGAHWGTFNTVLVPIILSWKLPNDFRVKFSFGIEVDNAWNSVNDSLASITKIGGDKLMDKNGINAYAWSGLGEWVFQPNIGISWLHAGWNISADFFYAWSLKNNTINYQSGDMFAAEYTLSYTCGKWTFGLGASQTVQVQSDKFDAGDGTGYHSQPGTKETKYQFGPLLGYNFGPCSLMFIMDWNLETKNAMGGEVFMTRLVVPLGNLFPMGGK
jgi:hypothetical protein